CFLTSCDREVLGKNQYCNRHMKITDTKQFNGKEINIPKPANTDIENKRLLDENIIFFETIKFRYINLKQYYDDQKTDLDVQIAVKTTQIDTLEKQILAALQEIQRLNTNTGTNTKLKKQLDDLKQT